MKYKSWVRGFWQHAQEVVFCCHYQEGKYVSFQHKAKRDSPGLSQLALVSLACTVGWQLTGLFSYTMKYVVLVHWTKNIRAGFSFILQIFFIIFQNRLLSFIHLTPREIRFDLTVENIDIMSQNVELKFKQCDLQVKLSL